MEFNDRRVKKVDDPRWAKTENTDVNPNLTHSGTDALMRNSRHADGSLRTSTSVSSDGSRY